jgi:hypothetical protein
MRLNLLSTVDAVYLIDLYYADAAEPGPEGHTCRRSGLTVFVVVALEFGESQHLLVH